MRDNDEGDGLGRIARCKMCQKCSSRDVRMSFMPTWFLCVPCGETFK